MTKEYIQSTAGQESRPIVMKRGFCSEYCDWDEEIHVSISNDLVKQIARCREILKENLGFQSIKISVPGDFLDEECESRLNDVCRIGCEYIQVNQYDIYYCIQSKYDSNYTAEYCFDSRV